MKIAAVTLLWQNIQLFMSDALLQTYVFLGLEKHFFKTQEGHTSLLL